MRNVQKYIIRAIIFMLLITVLCPIAQIEAGDIFDFFRRIKGTIASQEAGKKDKRETVSKEEYLTLPRLYKVKAGDSLSGIARKFYGEVSKWTLVYEANKDKIKDPDRIEPGIELTIPLAEKEKVELSQIESVYQQAKEDFIRGSYPVAIVKFNQVVELEKDLYPVYTSRAREYIRQAQGLIKEQEEKRILAQKQRQEKLAREREKEKKRLQKAEERKKEIERKAKIESLYKIGKKYYQSKNYPNAACAFAEILALKPQDKNALKYYERCQREIIKEEIMPLLEQRQKQLLLEKQKQAELEKQAEEKARILQIEPYYQQGKESLTQGDYISAIVKFNQVIELEKDLYPVYTPYAREYIRQAQEKIKGEEEEQIQAQKEAEAERKRKQEELARRKEEERLKKEAEKREKLAQIESAYQEAQEVYLEAKAKFEQAMELEKDLGITSTMPGLEEFRDYLAQQEEKLTELEQEKKDIEAKQVLAPKKEVAVPEEVIRPEDVIKEEPQTSEYTIGEGDELYISIWQEPNLSREIIVRPDGKISFPLAGDVPAAGLTFTQLKEDLTQRLKNYVKYPVVSISLIKLGGKKIIVLGEVGRPGVHSVTGKRTVLEAIALAGGFTPHAVASSVILIRGGLQTPQGERLNLTRAIDRTDMSQNVVLEGENIVYVPKKFIANVNYALSQILGPVSKGISTVKDLED